MAKHHRYSVLISVFYLYWTAQSQSCSWQNGQAATDYYACNPDAAQSNCCLQGEACVSNGLCYGSLGMIYRGACSGGWGNDTACPQACNSAGSDGSWANLFMCPSISAPTGANSWWCGDSSVVTPCDQSGTNSNPTKAQIFSLPWDGMLPQAILPWPNVSFTGCAVSQNNPYSVEKQIQNATAHQSNSSSNSTGSTTPTTATQKTCSNGAQIGEGVAIGVVALVAAAMACWAFYERREKNRLLAGSVMPKQDMTHYQQHYPQYSDVQKDTTWSARGHQASHQAPASEMDTHGRSSRPPAFEMQS